VSELERVADSDRERAVAALREHTVAGRLTLEELAERVGIALAARTRAELGGAVADLPSMTAAAELPDEEASVLGLFGNVTRTGRWRLGRRVRARGIFGGVRLDLRHAEVTADEVWVDVRAICGEVSVVVPTAWRSTWPATPPSASSTPTPATSACPRAPPSCTCAPAPPSAS
jgi:uncharacterized protein DUF1707